MKTVDVACSGRGHRNHPGLAALTLVLATGVAAASPRGPLGAGNGTFTVAVEDQGGWRLAGAVAFDRHFRQRPLTVRLHGSGPVVRLRLSHAGGTAAHIDAVTLNGKAPRRVVSAREPAALALRKVAAHDHDVIDVQGRTLVLEFDAPGAAAADLALTARIEPTRITTTPFRFPEDNLHTEITTRSSFYRYTPGQRSGALTVDGDLAGERLATPLFAVFCEPGTGHPSNHTYGWVMDDGEHLYVAIDFVSDNTMDGTKDYAAVQVKVGARLTEYRVSTAERRWGRSGYQYTSRAAYQHKVYEMKIPLAELGLERNHGKMLELAFSAYGTSAPDTGPDGPMPDMTAPDTMIPDKGTPDKGKIPDQATPDISTSMDMISIDAATKKDDEVEGCDCSIDGGTGSWAPAVFVLALLALFRRRGW